MFRLNSDEVMTGRYEGWVQRRHSLLTRVDKVQGPPMYKGPPSATCVTKSRHTHILLESSESGNRA